MWFRSSLSFLTPAPQVSTHSGELQTRRRVSGGPRLAGRGDHVAVSRHQSRKCLAASPRRVFRTLEDLVRNGPKRKMVVLPGRRSKVLPTVAGPCPRRKRDTSRRCRAARDVPPHGARVRVRRPHADSASVLPFGKTPASIPPPPAFRHSPKRAASLAGRRSGKRSRRQKASGWSFLPSCLREVFPPARASSPLPFFSPANAVLDFISSIGYTIPLCLPSCTHAKDIRQH